MNRWLKNTILIGILLLLFLGDFFLVKSIKSTSSNININNINNNGVMPNDGNMAGDGETPPEKPDGDKNNGDNETSPEMQDGNMTSGSEETPPEKPDGDNGSEPPDGYGGGQGGQSGSNDINGNGGTSPSKPGENSNISNAKQMVNEVNSSDTEVQTNDATDNNTPPEMPEGKDGGEVPQMPGENGTNDNNSSNDNTLVYVGIGFVSTFEGLVIMYLALSLFNKKTLKETFHDWTWIAVFILSSIIIAEVFYGVKIKIPKYLNNNSTSEVNKINDNTSVDTTGSTTVTTEETLKDTYSSTTSDESAILVKDGGNATISGTITKSGDSSNTENSEFYGVNAAILVTKGSTATIKNANITTSAKGANAVFSTGEDSKIYISDSTIKSTGSSSARGLDATYGGYIEATNVTISTEGGSCATVATDRGEGTVKVSDSTLSTAGKGSPIVYSTGDITLTNTKGTATGSQAIVIEGKNSATISSSTLTCSGTGNRETADIAGVMIYQSMSGDASTGTGTLSAADSSIIIDSNSEYYKTAPMFFITNTDAVINLQNTTLTYGSNILISAKGTSEWGNEGSNGGNVELNATNQTLTGNIELDNISTLVATFTKTTYKGAINGDNTAKSVTLKLDKNSKITLTGDSYITSLDNADTTNSNIDFNGYKLYVNGKAIN